MATGSAIVVGPAACLGAVAAELGMTSETGMGLFLGLPFWGLGTVTLFSGWLAERLGYRNMLAASALIQTAGYLLVSAAETVPQAFAAILLAGLGRGLPAAPLNALLCSLHPGNRTGAMNVFHAFFYVGMVVLSGLVLGMFALGWEWRWVFRSFAVMVLAFGAAAFLVRFPRPRADAPGRLDLRFLLRQPAFAWIGAAILFSAVTEIGPSTWFPYFIEKAAGSSHTLGVLSLVLLGTTMAAGRLGCARMVARVGVPAVLTACCLLSAASILLAALPVGTSFTVFWLTVLGLAITVSYPTAVACAGDRFPGATPSMYALLNGAAHVGGVAGPALIGAVAEAVGLRPAMGVVALAPLCLLFAVKRALKR